MRVRREMMLYHATTPRKLARYRATGAILRPVSGFTTLEGAREWASHVCGRTVFVRFVGKDCHKLPDHHNRFGEAWWSDTDVDAYEVLT